MKEKAPGKENAPKGNVLFVPGVGEYIEEAFTDFNSEMNKRGYEITFLQHADPRREEDLSEDFAKAKRKAVELNKGRIPKLKLERLLADMPLILFRETKAFLDQIDEYRRAGNDPQLNIIAHSQGALIITMAAILRPDFFEGGKIILTNPVGFTEKREPREYSKPITVSEKIRDLRFFQQAKWFGFDAFARTLNMIRKFVLSGEPSGTSPGLRGTIDYFFDKKKGYKPRWKALGELHALANTDIIPYLDALKNDLGIEVVVRHGEDDGVFDSETIRGRAIADNIDEETGIDGHNALIVRAAEVADEVDQIFTPNVKEKEAT